MRLLLLAVLLAAGAIGGGAASLRCSRARPLCADRTMCCNRYGFCGRTAAYCGISKCIGGPCFRPTKPKPKPRPKPKPVAAKPSPPPPTAVLPVTLSPPPPSPTLPPRTPAPPPPSPSPLPPSPLLPPPSPSNASVPWVPPPFPDELGDDAVQYSWLWGQNGELWSPTSRLADWSYAGYMAGEAPIPSFPAEFNVRSYGAKGDGVADDTKAIQLAIQAASSAAARLVAGGCGLRGKDCANGFGNEGRQGVAVLLPAGRYKITQTIEVGQSNVVVRGEGVDRTVLYFPKPLQDIYGDAMAWSYMGGFLICRGQRLDGDDTQYQLGRVKATARKGDRRLTISSTAGMTVGRWVRLYAVEPSATAALARTRRLQQDTGEPLPEAAATALQDFLQSLPGSWGRWSVTWSGRNRPVTSGKQKQGGRRRPLTPGMQEGKEQAEALGLDQPEREAPDAATRASAAGDGSGAKASAAAAAGTLDYYLYGSNPSVDSATSPFSAERIRFASRVSAVGPGWVELERPLPYDLHPEWQVHVYSFQHPVQHVGYENFTVEFEHGLYPAHMKAAGYNAFYYQSCANSWVRNVRIVDADTGAEAINSDFITMRNIQLEFTAPRGNAQTQGCNGHHGLWAAASSNVLFTEIDFCSNGKPNKKCFIHDFTLDVFAQENAYTNSRGVDMSLDCHRGGVHNNLFSNIDVGLGNRAFLSSGDASRGAHAAANNTWWGISASTRDYARAGGVKLPSCNFGPQLNWVGASSGPPQGKDAGVSPAAFPLPSRLFPGYCTSNVRWWVEQLRPGASLYPPDLQAAMAEARIQRLQGGNRR